MNNFGNGRTVCNFCGEDISADAKRCPYCGSLLASDNSFKVDEVKTDDFGNNGSQMQDIKMDSPENPFNYDNPVDSDNSPMDFSYEERAYGNGIEEALNKENVDEKYNEIQKPSDIGNFNMGTNQTQQVVNSVQRANNVNNPRQQGYQRVGVSGQSVNGRPSISNAMKVFITSVCTLVPGLGQLIGVIIAIVFMNSEGDADKRSFGVALLVNSLIVFVLACLSCCVLIAIFSES